MRNSAVGSLVAYLVVDHVSNASLSFTGLSADQLELVLELANNKAPAGGAIGET